MWTLNYRIPLNSAAVFVSMRPQSMRVELVDWWLSFLSFKKCLKIDQSFSSEIGYSKRCFYSRKLLYSYIKTDCVQAWSRIKSSHSHVYVVSHVNPLILKVRLIISLMSQQPYSVWEDCFCKLDFWEVVLLLGEMIASLYYL